MKSSTVCLPLAGLAFLCACDAPFGANEGAAVQDTGAISETALPSAPSAAVSEPAVVFRQAAEPGYPLLPEQGMSADEFVPAGWTLVEALEGDLNGDGSPDLALLMRESDPRKIERDGVELNTNPYRIAVAFRAGEGTYRLTMENHRLIPRHTNRQVENPFEDFALNNGSLVVHLHHFANMGGWGMATMKYRFRYQQGAFHLIGYDRIDTQRNTGAVETVSVNYLTGKVKHGKGSIDSEQEATSWSDIPRAPLLRIDQVGDGMGFDPVATR